MNRQNSTNLSSKGILSSETNLISNNLRCGSLKVDALVALMVLNSFRLIIFTMPWNSFVIPRVSSRTRNLDILRDSSNCIRSSRSFIGRVIPRRLNNWIGDDRRKEKQTGSRHEVRLKVRCEHNTPVPAPRRRFIWHVIPNREMQALRSLASSNMTQTVTQQLYSCPTLQHAIFGGRRRQFLAVIRVCTFSCLHSAMVFIRRKEHDHTRNAFREDTFRSSTGSDARSAKIVNILTYGIIHRLPGGNVEAQLLASGLDGVTDA